MPEKKPEPIFNAETTRTAYSMLKFALKQLSNISSQVPSGRDPQWSYRRYARAQQASDNAEGLIQLALRIKHLTPTVTRMAENDLQKGQSIVEELQKELASIKTELEAALSRGKLNQFFNSADNASIWL
ncbi:hypothetical protein C8R45DRAFT_933813 [Mycena sanguinolenta]|nr:hypothetical protein C8R45DRAFT_933813 [Mycena sanguinolenta]